MKTPEILRAAARLVCESPVCLGMCWGIFQQSTTFNSSLACKAASAFLRGLHTAQWLSLEWASYWAPLTEEYREARVLMLLLAADIAEDER